MATANTGANRRANTRGKGPRLILAAAAVIAAAAWFYRAPIDGYATTGAAFAARTACACRHVAGRSLDDCEKDFEPGMQIVFLSEDAEERSVTARVPLLASDTARYRRGYGCLLDPWEA